MTRRSDEVKNGLKRIVLNRRVWVFLMTMMMIVGPLPIERTQAATLTVDRTDDDAGATACTGAANDCSLRGAIIAANAMVGADTIMVPAGTYTLTIAGQLDDAALMGDLDLTESLTIKGAGQASTIIQAGTTVGSGIDRVFHILSGSVTAEFMDLTIRHGTRSHGGGIYNEGTLTLTSSTLSGNSASSLGGGIYNEDRLTVTNSTLSGNSAGILGGGIFNDTGGSITVINSTLSGNSANTRGGGIFHIDDSRSATIMNSTLSNNSATEGGGIFNGDKMTISNSTLSNNSATEGGGICNAFGKLTIKNSIVANSPSGGDCVNDSGTFTASGKNLDTDGSCASLDPNFMQVTPAQLNLGPLQLNAPGTTRTHALLTGSVAMNAVTDCTDLQTPTPQPVTTDQRGVPRPQGLVCDVGAYEAQIQPPSSSTSLTLQGNGVCLTLNLKTRQYIFKNGQRTIAGIFSFRQSGQVLRFQSAYGDVNRLSGWINLSTRAGSAVLTLPLSLGGQRFTFTTLATAPCL